MKNILFTSKNTTKLSAILLSTVFSMIAATSADASKKPNFLDYDQNGAPLTSSYTSKRGVNYNLGERTMSLRSSPSKQLWNRATNKRKAVDVDVIVEPPLKRQKTADQQVDPLINFDEAPQHSTTLMPSTEIRYVPNVEEIVFDEGSFETGSFNRTSPIFSVTSFEKSSTDNSEHHASFNFSGSNQGTDYEYLVDAPQMRKGRMAEHFEMIAELKRSDDEFGVSHHNSTSSSVDEDSSSMEEEIAEPIYDFGLDSFKRVATKRNLAVAAGVATGAALAYKFYTDGFGTVATEALNTAPNFINTTLPNFFNEAVTTTVPHFFNSSVNTTLGFCPVQEVCTAVYPNMTSSFVNNTLHATSSVIVPEVTSFMTDVCQALPSNVTNTFGMQTIAPQVVETVTQTGGSYWSFFSNAFINLNKNTHL